MRKLTTALLAATALAGAFASSHASAAQDRRLYGDTYGYGTRTAKPDPFTDGARMGKFDPYAEGARMGKYDPYTDGGRMGKYDPYSDGARCLDTDRAPL